MFLDGPKSVLVCEISEMTDRFLHKLCEQTGESKTKILKEIARQNKYVLDEQRILKYILEKANFREQKKGAK